MQAILGNWPLHSRLKTYDLSYLKGGFGQTWTAAAPVVGSMSENWPAAFIFSADWCLIVTAWMTRESSDFCCRCLIWSFEIAVNPLHKKFFRQFPARLWRDHSRNSDFTLKRIGVVKNYQEFKKSPVIAVTLAANMASSVCIKYTALGAKRGTVRNGPNLALKEVY